MRRLLALLILLTAPSWAATKYVDCAADPGGDGTTQATTGEHCAWDTIADVNAASFSAGDSILFNKGCTWRERLIPPSSGSAGNVITFGAYGTGADPIISGADDVTAGSWTQATSGATVTAALATFPDDARELGANYYDDTFHNLGYASGTISGFVFHGLAVAKDATIVSAKITFRASNSLSADICKVILKAEAVDNPSAFVNKADFDARKVNLTTNNAPWTAPAFTSGSDYDTPDLGAVVNEITTRTGWVSGQNLCIFMFDNGSTGGAYRQVKGYFTGSEVNLPVLSVTYGSPLANVYYTAAVTADPGTVWFDGVTYPEAASAAAVNSTNRWFWSAGDSRLYVYATSAPGGFYALIEAPNASRVNALACSNRSYITVQNIEFQRAYNTTFYLLGTATNWIVQDGAITGDGSVAALRIKEAANYCTIQRCTITGGNKSGIDVVKISDTDAPPTVGTIFQYNTVKNAMHTALAIPNASGTICQYNYVKNEVSWGYGRAFTVENGDGVGGNIIRYNWFEGSYASEDYAQDGNKFNGDGNEFYGNVVSVGNDCGLQMSLYTLEGIPLVAQNNKVYNNVFYGFSGGPLWDSHKACIAIYDGGLRSPSGNVFKNNIIFGADDTNHYQIELLAGSTIAAYTFTNNCLYDSTTTSTVYDGAAARTVAYMEANDPTHWASNIVGNPLFTNPAAGDFTLQAGSPCIDAGADLTSTYQTALMPGSTWVASVLTGNQYNAGQKWEAGAYLYPNKRQSLIVVSK